MDYRYRNPRWRTGEGKLRGREGGARSIARMATATQVGELGRITRRGGRGGKRGRGRGGGIGGRRGPD